MAGGGPPGEDTESVLAFWFGSESDAAAIAARQAALWWGKDPAVDRAVAQRFGVLVERVGRGELDHWAPAARGRLALILLADQLPRNIFRGAPEAFARDPLALTWCLDGIERGLDRELRPIERVFFYMPLEHSESLDHQQRCVALHGTLCEEAPAGQRTTFQQYRDFAERHSELVARFGRFPHRNALLGRESSASELAYLAEPDAGF